MKTDHDKTVQVESKQAWTKPELELVSIKDKTLATVVGFGGDAGLWS